MTETGKNSDAAVAFKDVDIFFGSSPAAAILMARDGKDREEILDATGVVLGVTGCTLNVEPGEICVLMGLSGSGKSTLLRAVNGLNEVSHGNVWLADGENGRVDVAACSAATLRRLRMERVAMVFQQFALLPWCTVAENVGLGLALRGMSKADRRRIVAEKLALVHLEAWADKYAHELSGGMQQRVGLARAFATDADILLMDEPFSALDPLIRNHLQDELLDLQKRLGKTILFVSHDLDEAMKLGNHIAIMEGGRIIQNGRPEDIVLRPSSQYVADFVAHLNPLAVLTCTSIMRPLAALPRDGATVFLDAARQDSVTLGPGDVIDDPRVELLTDASKDTLPQPNRLAAAGPGLRLEIAIRWRHASGRSILIVDGRRLVGVVGDAEIYRGLLREPETV